jgi:hypothetical protein
MCRLQPGALQTMHRWVKCEIYVLAILAVEGLAVVYVIGSLVLDVLRY